MERITAYTLKEMLENDEDFILINTLSKEAFGREHIPGSINVPADSRDLVERINELSDSKEQKLVVYCASPECTAAVRAGKKLEEAGFVNVVYYLGGMLAWKEAGYEVERKTSQQGEGRTQPRGCCG